MAVTKEQWEEIEKHLMGTFAKVEFICDGYKVEAIVQLIAPLKFAINVYVDGYIKGEWVINNSGSEIPLKFHQEKKRYICHPKLRAWYIKESKSRIWPKEKRAEFAADAKKTLSSWCPYWTSSKAFCRHIRKTCTSIEIVKIGY